MYIEREVVARDHSLLDARSYGCTFNQKLHRAERKIAWFLHKHILQLPCEVRPHQGGTRAVADLAEQWNHMCTYVRVQHVDRPGLFGLNGEVFRCLSMSSTFNPP